MNRREVKRPRERLTANISRRTLAFLLPSLYYILGGLFYKQSNLDARPLNFQLTYLLLTLNECKHCRRHRGRQAEDAGSSTVSLSSAPRSRVQAEPRDARRDSAGETELLRQNTLQVSRTEV